MQVAKSRLVNLFVLLGCPKAEKWSNEVLECRAATICELFDLEMEVEKEYRKLFEKLYAAVQNKEQITIVDDEAEPVVQPIQRIDTSLKLPPFETPVEEQERQEQTHKKRQKKDTEVAAEPLEELSEPKMPLKRGRKQQQPNYGQYLSEWGTWTFILNIKEKSEDGERHTYVLDLIKALREQGWRWTEEFIWRKTSAIPGKWRTRLRDGWERLLQFNKTFHFAMYQEAVMRPPTEATILRAKRAQTLLKFRVHKGSSGKHRSSTGSGFTRNYANQSLEWVLPDNVLELSTEPVSQKHSAVFPKGIPEFFINLFTAEGDTVLDPFLGSGTTGFVARRMGRNFVGIEVKPEYVQVTSERIFGDS